MFNAITDEIMGTLGQEPPFNIVTMSLLAKYLITDDELEEIEAMPTPAQKGKKITKFLKKKIEQSDDPVGCLLTICDVFESEKVDNAKLKKYGASMRSNFPSKKTSGSYHS